MAIRIGINNPILIRWWRRKRQALLPWYQQNKTLANSLVALWKLDESGGARVDSIGTSTLSDVNTVLSAAGITSPLAAEFVIANSEYLFALDSPTLSAGNIDLWGAVWCRPSAVNVTSCIMGKWNTSGNREWQIAQVNADVTFQVSSDGTATGNGAVTAVGALKTGEWTLIVWYHDNANDRIGLSINGDVFATATHSTGIFNSVAALTIGRQGQASATYFGGRIQQVMLGKGYVPTLQDAVYLYNKGVNHGVQSLVSFGLGGEVDWSPDGERLVFDRRDQNGNYQLYTIRADGSSEICISDVQVSGGPSVSRHKGFPAWHPNGNYIVCQVEMEVHNGDRSLSEPGRGHQCDVWVVKADGSQWWKLTNYSGETVSGVLNPRFSQDGTKLLWARKIGGVIEGAPLGQWDLQLADFALVDGVPSVSNVTTLDPAGTFYESHGFNRDGSKIIFTSDGVGNSPYGLDVYAYTLPAGPLVNLTNSTNEWDEHAHHASHADVIAFMSSRHLDYSAADVPAIGLTKLKSEVFVMNADGSGWRQLTHFNTPGFTEYDAERSVATVCSWSPDGRKLAVAQLMLEDRYDTVAGRRLWMVTFQGEYA